MPPHRGEHRRALLARAAITPANLLRGRFTGLTIVLLTLWLVPSVIGQKSIRELGAALAFSVLLIFAIWSAGRRLRIVMVTLAVPTVIGHWALLVKPSPMLRPAVFGVTTVFFIFLTLVILFAVFQDQAVTADTIVGAVCAYFLIGLTWGIAYALLITLSPDAFSISPGLANGSEWGSPTSSFTPLLQYYSFTTLATIGYGDITPVAAGARALSVLEGITGQLYLAVLIARLVGLHTARSREQQ